MKYVPRICEWEITLACDLACPHCSALAGEPRPDELDTRRAIEVAAQLSELGCEAVALTGGEPLQRPDWPDIARALSSRGILVSILTNGWALDLGAAREIRLAGVTQVALSLDGLRETHDAIRIPGSFDRVIDALDHLGSTGVRTSVTTTLSRLNLPELEAIHDLVCRTPATSWHVLLAARNGRDIPGFWLDPGDVLDVVPALASLRASSPLDIRAGDNVGYYGRHERDLRRDPRTMGCWSGCYAGRYIMGIESDGGIKGCLSMPSARHGTRAWVEGNVRDTPLGHIWDSPGAFLYNRASTALSGKCKACRYAALCRGGCRWTARHHPDGTMDNEYCYHRQLPPLPRPSLRQMTSAAALSLGLALGGCYQSHTVDDSPPTVVTPGPPEALFLPSWGTCDSYTPWADVVPASPLDTAGLSLPLGSFDDLTPEDHELLSSILCPYGPGLDWLHPCCMSRIELFYCLQGFCTPCADDASGTLTVSTNPVTTVLVDDVGVGATPVTGLALAPGIHLVTLVNEEEGIHKSYYAMIVNCGLTEIDRDRAQLVE